jgi:hypothetical protein
MATTPNYGWVTPAPTDFVTDLPADFEIFADAVDASFAAAEGDLLVGGATNIFEPLTIGALDTVLTSDGTTASWVAPATPPAPTTDFTLLNSGNTSVGASSSFTVSGISGVNKLHIYFRFVSSTNAGALVFFRFNSDSTNVYDFGGVRLEGYSVYTPDIFGNNTGTTLDRINVAKTSGVHTSTAAGGITLDGCNSTNTKVFTSMAAANEGGSNSQLGQLLVGTYSGTATISSVTIAVNTGNFDNGNIFIYGA